MQFDIALEGPEVCHSLGTQKEDKNQSLRPCAYDCIQRVHNDSLSFTSYLYLYS